MTTLNYQQIFEEEMNRTTVESLGMSPHFHDLSDHERRFIEELVDLGFRSAIKEALDPEILQETVILSAELGGQLYNFANMLSDHLTKEDVADLDE